MTMYQNSREELPENFFKQAREHLRKVQDMHGDLTNVQKMFNGMKDIGPYHRDLAIKTLGVLQGLIKALCNLLSQCSNFPIEISLQWYQLLISLRYISGLEQDLEKLLTSHSRQCHFFSKQVLKQREDIYFRLKELTSNCSDH